MIDRMLDYVGFDAAKLDEDKSIENFKDYDKIPTHSRDAIDTLVKADVIDGRGDGRFDPYGSLDRAAMVKVLDQSLKFVDFISE